MEEENKNDVELAEMLDETSPEVEQEPTEQEVAQPEEAPQAEATPQTEMGNVRFKTLRDGKKKAEQERDALLRQLENVRNSQQPQQQQQEVLEEDLYLDPDSIVEGKHLTQYDKKFKKMQEKLDAYEQRATVSSVEANIRAKHPDFASVVNDENIAVLKNVYPELAATIGSSSDLYNKALAAYTLIKKLGIESDGLNQEEVQSIQKNANKPRSSQSVSAKSDSPGPISQANAFSRATSEEENARIYAQALAYKRNR